MNRRSFFKRAGILTGLAAMAPSKIMADVVKSFSIEPEKEFKTPDDLCKWLHRTLSQFESQIGKVSNVESMRSLERHGHIIRGLFSKNEKVKYFAFAVDDPEEVYADKETRIRIAKDIITQINMAWNL